MRDNPSHCPKHCPKHYPAHNGKSLNRITPKRDNGITKSVKNKDTRFR